MVDRHGTIIYGGSEVAVGTHWKESILLNRISNEGKHGVIEDDTALHVYGKLDASLSGWTLVKKFPIRTLYLRATRLTQIDAVIIGTALLFVIIATLWMSIKITESIKRLTRYINQMQSGQLDVDIRTLSNDEIGLLSRSFRQMMDTVNNLILREYRLELANKTNQLKALQDDEILDDRVSKMFLQHNGASIPQAKLEQPKAIPELILRESDLL